jgi:hypothetical protein
MGLSDTVVMIDDLSAVACPAGHKLRSFSTKDLDEPSMSTYLVRSGRLYRAVSRSEAVDADEDSTAWRFEGEEAVQERRFSLEEIRPVKPVRVYGRCSECEPVLVRTDRAWLGDIVQEHELFVDFLLTFRAGEPVQVERVSGNREQMKSDLCARGLCVLRDDEPLAVAHREVREARERSGRSVWR